MVYFSWARHQSNKPTTQITKKIQPIKHMIGVGLQDFDGTPGQKGKADEKTRVNEAGRKIEKGYRVG